MHSIKTSTWQHAQHPLAATASNQAPRLILPTPPSASTTAAPSQPPIILDTDMIKMHSATQQELEVMDSLQPYMEESILPLLQPVDELWQPNDFLPDVSNDDAFYTQVQDLRQRCSHLPDELLVVLVGDMITEEALPTYMAMLNTLDGVRDETGMSSSPYAKWTREWVAEENRHGDLLNKYLYLSGRVHMPAVERTIQNLIGSGMDPGSENHPYLCFIYTSFQERATKISHGNTARLANEAGDEMLAKICGAIAADEGRHETAYTRIIDGVFDKDPNGAMLAFADMMKKKITMPAHYMNDGEHSLVNSSTERNLFEDFSAMAEDLQVYTAMDYIKIMEHLIGRWKVSKLRGLSDEAVEAQEYVLGLPERMRKLVERREMRRLRGKRQMVRFSWLNKREIGVL